MIDRTLRLVVVAAIVLSVRPASAGQTGEPPAQPADTAPAAVPVLPSPFQPAPKDPAPKESAAPPATPAAPTGTPAANIRPPEDYLIGTEDVLNIVFWRDKDMSGEVVVRPDGKITLPLLNDMQASGLTTEQLRAAVETAAAMYIEEPTVSVIVKQINSRKVFITGEVGRPGPFPLIAPTTVLQLIATAGGLREFAHRDQIVIMRTEGDKQSVFSFDWVAVVQKKKTQQNIFLKPGDVVVVP